MLPPGLSMLWEPVEPEEALRTRFGFGGLDAAVDWLGTILSDVWAITVQGCERVVISDRNAIIWVESSRGPLVVKVSSARDRFAHLAACARLVRRLQELRLPVAGPIETADGQVRVVGNSPIGLLSVAVLPRLEGGWLDINDGAAVRAAGTCLADLHQGLRAYSDDQLRPVIESEALIVRVDRWLAEGDRGWAPAASARLQSLVADLPRLDGQQQLVHNDFRSANILMKGSRIAAVLDFDEVAWSHPVSDLAKASVYLHTRFTDWRPTPVPVREQLRAGYESVRRLEPAEERWLNALVLWYGIRALSGQSHPADWAEAL